MTNRQLATKIWLLVLYFVSDVKSIQQHDDIVVSLANGGRVRGSILTSTQGSEFYAFRGIPYAEPPEGALRFKPPVPKKPWSDEILDATEDGPVCIQFNLFAMAPMGQEDCLRINVYTTKISGSEKKAVMAYIHGGAFMMGDGSSRTYSPEMLMDSDIVLVTLNYRLDAFGFLSTGDAASPGNYGLLDQTLALKWIKENIEMFGGNPERVTIFGESAGAASVSLHVLSPLSRGLFHGAIAMSAAATCSWVINEDVSDWSKRLAEDFNCPTSSSQELVNCLRQTSARDIVKITHTYMKMSVCPIPFRPNVDGYFLPEHPLKLLCSPDKINRVPVISGITEEEGAFFITHILLTNYFKSLTSEDFQKDIIDHMFGNFEPVKEVTKLVTEAYLANVDITNEDEVRSALIDSISEGLFEVCHYETVSLLSKAGLKTFAYSYDYEAFSSYTEVFGVAKKNWGTTHADDLLMFFPYPGISIEKDKEMSQTMIKLWTNFAKHGIPVLNEDKTLPKWPAIQEDKLSVYHFDDPITVQTFDAVNTKNYQFWNEVVRKAKVKKYDEYTHAEL